MPIYKNVASQKLAVYAYDPTTAAGTDPSKTGDAANITAQISKDGGVSAATNDVNPTELDATDHPGIYIFDLTQAETNADMIIVSAKSATANILLDPVEAFTTPGDNAALNANLTEIEGDTQSATDLKDFADSGYDPSTNKVQGVVLVDTTTTNSDMRGTDSAALASNVPDSLSHANLKIQLVTDYHLDHLLAADYDPASKPGVATALLNELIESDSGVSRLTANALEQGPVATGFSTHSAADVWTSGTRTLTGLGFTFVAGDFGASSLDGKGDWNVGKTGYSLVATGADLVLCDGRTLPNTLEIIAAAVAGPISGAGTGTETFLGMDEATTRVVVTVDSSGNRSDIVYS